MKSYLQRLDCPSLILFSSYIVFCICKSNLTIAHGIVGAALAGAYAYSAYLQAKLQPELQKEIIALRKEVQEALNQNSVHINKEVDRLKNELTKFQMISNKDNLYNKPNIKF